MKQIPYWLDTAPALPDRSGKDLPEEADVVVIGGGLTGLSTAYHAARKGARTVLVESENPSRHGPGPQGEAGRMAALDLLDHELSLDRRLLAPVRSVGPLALDRGNGPLR